MAMRQRSHVKLVGVAICLGSALLCALNHAPIVAAVQGIAAIVVWRFRFGLLLDSSNVEALLARLRDARTAEQTRSTATRATVVPSGIVVPTPSPSTTRWAQFAIAFRDEVTADRWRELTTALRHQPRAVTRSRLTGKTGRT